MQNYINYFTEIEEHFQRRRGSILLLSTLDWALIDTWREAGVPLAAVLRGIVLDAAPGTLLGSEDALVARLSVSRSTVRQIARLLEREGLLLVRRGINGGYYGARPTIGTIETTVSAYLETLDMDSQDLTTVASVLCAIFKTACWASAV